MKFKSIVLIFVAFVFGVLFVVYSTSAQKSKANDETKNENQSQENLIAELRKNEVCTVLSENIMAKEAENLTMKRAKCGDSSPYVYLVLQKGEKELTISVIDLKTPEDAKEALRTTFGQEGFRPYNEFGDEGHKDSTNINFIKGRLFVNVYFKHFDSDETPKRFAEYALKAIQGR
jgi:hypothetical protein